MEYHIEDGITYTFTSPAKINLFLKIGKKESDGMHKILSFMRRINLCDEIVFSFEKKEGKGLKFSINVAAGEVLKGSKAELQLKSIENG